MKKAYFLTALSFVFALIAFVLLCLGARANDGATLLNIAFFASVALFLVCVCGALFVIHEHDRLARLVKTRYAV